MPDQDDVTGMQVLAQPRHRLVVVGDEHRLLPPGAFEAGAQVDRPRRFTHHHELGDVETHGQSANSVVLLAAGLAQLAHLAEHRDGAGVWSAAPRDGRERLERGPHRVGVGVVGVVDHQDAVGALVLLHPPAGGVGRRGQRGRHVVERHPEAERDGCRGGGVASLVLAE